MEFATKSKVASFPKFAKWFIDNAMPHYTGVAVAGTSEDGVEKAIIDVMVSENVDGAKKAGHKVALKKFRIACRDQYEVGRAPRSEDSSLVDDPIPKAESL